MRDILVNGRYRVGELIGRGGFGWVYSGIDVKTGEEVAIKLGAIEPRRRLSDESGFYKTLSKAKSSPTGFPLHHWYGIQDEYEVLVVQMLGPSLSDLVRSLSRPGPDVRQRRISLKTGLLLAEQGITRIWHLHKKGILHGDIKPGNMLMGTGRQGNVLHIIDFGTSLRTDDPRAATPGDIGNAGEFDFIGTTSYAAIRIHDGWRYSYSDDLESLAYTLLRFLRGNLPWEGAVEPWMSNHQQSATMGKVKKAYPVSNLCHDLPAEFATFVNEVRATPRGTMPKYARFRNMFRSLYKRSGFTNDFCFDWTRMRYEKMLAEGGFDEPQVALE